MIARLNNARIRLSKNDDGIAIVMVIGISAVMMLLITVALGVAVSGMTKTKTDESWNGAIAAAYAGIEDYKSKIANDNAYYRYGNPASQFTASSGSAGSVSLPPTAKTNLAFGVGASGTWAPVPDSVSATADNAFYRYEVDNHEYLTSGVLKVRATGRVGTETRSVVANLKQKGFIDFLYYTTYEITDPGLSTSLDDAERAACTVYAYTPRPSYCSGLSIAFGANDTINGPMHSNDTIRACGSTFNGTVTTSYKPPTGQKAYKPGDANSDGCALTTTFAKGEPVTVSTLDLPPTNKAMFNEVRNDINAEVPRPGCLYTGPTKIVFNNDGTMTVRSPWTKVTQVSNAAGTVGTKTAPCGVPGTANGQLGSAGGANVPVPDQNLIYVQDVQFISTTPAALAPQYKSGTYPAKPSGGNYANSDCTAGNFLGYPLANEDVRIGVSNAYNCKKGDVFVEGTLNGEVSINAENYIYVTADIKYSTANTDSVLGLIAQNQVWIWNPMYNWNGSTTNPTGTTFNPGNRTVNAALLSVNKTIQVQNHDVGGVQGFLNVNGAIAQKFRGPVATSQSSVIKNGFKKNYNYDNRFLYIAPPKFLSPVSTTYGISTLVEVKTAFNPDGSAILP